MSYDRHQIARASAILTNTEVAGATLDLTKCHDGKFTCTAGLTIGALTNCILRAYVSKDGTTWDLAYNESGLAASITLTGTDTISMKVDQPGYLFARVTAEGTGGLGGSLLVMTYNWLRKGSQI